MRTQKYIQVEALVAKYKNLAKETELVKKVNSEFDTSMSLYVPRNVYVLEHEQNILAHFYSLKSEEHSASYMSKRWERHIESYISGLLSEEEESFILDNFDTLVEYLLGEEAHWDFSSTPLDSPMEWAALVPYILRSKGKGKVFIPCSCKGNEFVGLQNCELYVGGDYEYAAMRALCYGMSIRHHTKDCEYGEGMFDVVISNGLPDSVYTKESEYPSKFDQTYKMVREGGEMLISLTRRDLISDYTSDFRKMLKEKQELAEAIGLPSGDILLHIIKAPQKSFVMVDASTVTRPNGWKSKSETFDVQRFLELVKIADQPEFEEQPLCRRYEYSELEEDMFLPAFYLTRPEEGISIADLADNVKDTIVTDQCDGTEKVVTINNLSKTFAKSQFSFDDLKQIDCSRHRTYKAVTGPCVVLAASEEGVAVGYTLESKTLLVPWNMSALTSSDAVNIRYLAAVFCDKITAHRLLCLAGRKGQTAWLCSNWESLFTIPSTSLEQKKVFVENALLANYAEQEKTLASSYANHIRSIRLRKHALSQNISAFDSVFRTLEMHVKGEGGVIRSSDKISPISDMTISDAFEYLHTNLDVIRERVDHIAENQDWGKCESIEPQQFVEEYEKQRSSVRFKFSHSWEEDEKNCFEEDIFDEKTGKLIFHAGETANAAWFPKAALSQVLDNIVSNAQEHGFTDGSRQDYRINFSWSTDGLNMILRVSNNGEPLSSGISADNVLQYGYSSALNTNGHGGIGGGQIYEIMQKYGGSVEIISAPEKEMTVTYVLSMPLASLY